MDRIGRFQIVKELGRGAMGVVYHALDPAIGRPVAIKVIRLSEMHKPEDQERLRERLFREARSAGILSHPNIVTIYDMDEEDGLAFIAMEFVNGSTLDQVLSAKEPMAEERMFSSLRQTGGALDFAHGKGIVHRDIKPANIMLAEGDVVKITDFGIAKITTGELTMTGTIVGTPNYMSPEQVQGLTVDGRSDQFSLAVIAFEMLTGERPFAGEHLTSVIYKIVSEDPVPLQRLNPTVGDKIDGVLRKALSKKRESRYGTCTEFVEALEAACAATEGWKNLPRGGVLSMPTMAVDPRPPLPPPRFRRNLTEEEPRRSRALPIFGALIVAAGLAGLLGWQLQQRSAIPEPPPVPGSPASLPEQSAVQPPGEARAEPKPSALGSEVEEAKPETPQQERPGAPEPAAPEPKTRAALGPLDIAIPTNPAGATAILDGRPETACTTPCALRAAPGRHSVEISLTGYMTERRDVRVTDSAQELPLVTLRKAFGTLMLNSDPAGASITLDGKQMPQRTPAQLSLPAGTYTLTVEKNGMRKTEQVEIRNGATNYLRIPLGE